MYEPSVFGNKTVVQKDVSGTSYTLAGSEALQWGTRYGWHVMAIDAAGNAGNYSAERPFETMGVGSLRATAYWQIGKGGQPEQPVQGAEVVLYQKNGSGGWIEHSRKKTDSSGQTTTWEGLPAGRYNLELYYNGEFWAGHWTNDGAVEVRNDKLATPMLQRNEPYANRFKVEQNGVEVTGGTIDLNSAVTYGVTVTNQSPVDRSVRVLLWADRDKAAPYDVSSTSSPQTIAKNGGTATYYFTDTVGESGTHYYRFEVQTSINGNWVKTDSAGWATAVTARSADAQIARFDVPVGSLRHDQQASATVRVVNTGTTARSFWIGLSFAHESTTSAAWPEGWFDVAPKQTTLLQPGQPADIELPFTIPQHMPEGRYYAVGSVWDGFDGQRMVAPRYYDTRDNPQWNDGPDGQGSLSFSLVGRPVQDRFEANNTLLTATNLGIVTGRVEERGLTIHSATDQDWFRFETLTPSTDAHYVDVLFPHADSDLDVRLYDADGTLIRLATTVNDNERLGLHGLRAGTYYVKVYGSGGATSAYDLAIVAPAAADPDPGNVFGQSFLNALREFSGFTPISFDFIRNAGDGTRYTIEGTVSLGGSLGYATAGFTEGSFLRVLDSGWLAEGGVFIADAAIGGGWGE